MSYLVEQMLMVLENLDEAEASYPHERRMVMRKVPKVERPKLSLSAPEIRKHTTHRGSEPTGTHPSIAKASDSDLVQTHRFHHAMQRYHSSHSYAGQNQQTQRGVGIKTREVLGPKGKEKKMFASDEITNKPEYEPKDKGLKKRFGKQLDKTDAHTAAANRHGVIHYAIKRELDKRGVKTDLYKNEDY